MSSGNKVSVMIWTAFLLGSSFGIAMLSLIEFILGVRDFKFIPISWWVAMAFNAVIAFFSLEFLLVLAL